MIGCIVIGFRIELSGDACYRICVYALCFGNNGNLIVVNDKLRVIEL
jgi:hypothetical protein